MRGERAGGARIACQDLHFRYEETHVLKGLSFHVEDREIFGILGPNGVGKTTLIKVLGGLLQSTAGTALLRDRNLGTLSKKFLSKEVAYVPQEEEIFLPFTVEQIVTMGRAPFIGFMGFEGSQDLTAVREAMEATDTWSLKDRSVRELSGGERQRVILARAIAQQAPVLLLDEPTSHLDIRYQIEILELVASLNRSGRKTVIMTLHDINLAALYCERLALLKDGCLFAVGPPAEVITEETIREVFGTRVAVAYDDQTGRPHLHLLKQS